MRPVLLIPLLTFGLACLLPAASATEFTGVVEMTETISGLQSDGNDRAEFDRYAQLVDNRLKQARADLTTAPPVVAQTLREDLGFYQAELERIAVSTGRELALTTSNYKISRGRVVLITPLVRYRIDRNRGTAQSLLPDGTVADLTLAPLPTVDASGASDGPVMLGLATKRFERTIAGRTYLMCMALDLPNVCAMATISGATDDGLMAGVARLPGLPMLIEVHDGDIVRRLTVTRLEAKPVPDDEFAPWK